MWVSHLLCIFVCPNFPLVPGHMWARLFGMLRSHPPRRVVTVDLSSLSFPLLCAVCPCVLRSLSTSPVRVDFTPFLLLPSFVSLFSSSIPSHSVSPSLIALYLLWSMLTLTVIYLSNQFYPWVTLVALFACVQLLLQQVITF